MNHNLVNKLYDPFEYEHKIIRNSDHYADDKKDMQEACDWDDPGCCNIFYREVLKSTFTEHLHEPNVNYGKCLFYMLSSDISY